MPNPLEWDLQREFESMRWHVAYRMFHDDYGPKVLSKDLGRGGAVVSFISPKNEIVVDLVISCYAGEGGDAIVEIHSGFVAPSIAALEEYIIDRIHGMSMGKPLPDVPSLITRGTPIR